MVDDAVECLKGKRRNALHDFYKTFGAIKRPSNMQRCSSTLLWIQWVERCFIRRGKRRLQGKLSVRFGCLLQVRSYRA